MRISCLSSRAPHCISGPIRLAAGATMIAPLIHLPITASIELTVFSPISLAIFLSNIRLGEYHIR